jgi:small conductance mechanosensitive channel
MLKEKIRPIIVCVLCTLWLSAFNSFGQDDIEKQYSATTTANPQVPVEDLELLLKPLTREELIVEAQAWLELLKEKVRQTSSVEIQTRRKSREIDKKEDEIEQKIEDIEKTEKEMTEETASQGIAGESRQKAETVTNAEKEIQEKVETADEAESEIKEIAADVQTELQGKSQEELSGFEKDLKKTEEVIEATEKTKDTVKEIAQSDIELTDKVKKIGKAEVELHAKIKEQLLVGINKLREEQAAVIDRFNAVLTALKDKGGDIEEYEQYVAAISGLSLGMQDIRDVSAFRIIVWGWLKSTDGGLRWLKNIAFCILTLVAFYALAHAAGKVTRKTVSASKKFSDLLKEFFVSVVRKTIIVIGIVMALSMLEVNIAPFLAGLGVAGFVLGFALQGTLSNFASGLMILIYRPYDVGQIIEAAGAKGTVDSMNLVSTTIKTFDNQMVIVPNGEI